MRSLTVYLDQRVVGTLSEGNDLWTFDYDRQWVEARDGFDLSPALPRAAVHHADGATRRPVQWYFDNLLPEELLRQAIAKEAGIVGDDAFGLLEYLGAESAGALTLLPPGVPVPDAALLRPLPNEALSQRIAALPRRTLAHAAPKRMSLAGAQHKLLVVVKGQGLFEPEGATPSTHILKPDHPDADAYPASAINEYVTMRLARAARLRVPKVTLRYVPQPVYIVERFDRIVAAPPRVQRLHIIDACQLLNKARGFKHVGATLESLQQIIERTTNRIDTRQRLFRWLVFNILVANDDCHLKNLSFHVGADGVMLAPHYDLLCTGAYSTKAFADDRATWPHVPMAFALPGAGHFDEVSLAKVLDAAAVLGVPQSIARRVTAEVVTRVERAFSGLVAEHEQRLKEPTADTAPFIAAQARLLRVFAHITLPAMLSRFRGT